MWLSGVHLAGWRVPCATCLLGCGASAPASAPINTSHSVCWVARAWGANRGQGSGPLAPRAQLVGGPSQIQKRLDLETEYLYGDAPGGHGSLEGQVREVASLVRALKGR